MKTFNHWTVKFDSYIHSLDHALWAFQEVSTFRLLMPIGLLTGDHPGAWHFRFEHLQKSAPRRTGNTSSTRIFPKKEILQLVIHQPLHHHANFPSQNLASSTSQASLKYSRTHSRCLGRRISPTSKSWALTAISNASLALVPVATMASFGLA